MSGYPCANAAGNSGWEGVLCHEQNASLGSESGRVARLLLGNNRLTGQLPTQMAALGALRELSVRDNELTGMRRQCAGVIWESRLTQAVWQRHRTRN